MYSIRIYSYSAQDSHKIIIDLFYINSLSAVTIDIKSNELFYIGSLCKL